MSRPSHVVCLAVVVFFTVPSVSLEYRPSPWKDHGCSSETTEVVINELNVAPGAGDAEFIELYNSGDEAVDLSGLSVQDQRSQPIPVTGDSRLLLPGAYVVLTQDSSVIAGLYGPVPMIRVSPWPSLNNAGDDIVISSNHLVLDRVPYSASWYAPGKSMERVDPAVPGFISSNWKSNTTSAGASPGRVNSNFHPDTRRPAALSAEYVSATSVEIIFSESIDPASLSPGRLLADDAPVVEYLLESPFTSLTFGPNRVISEVELLSFSDFAGNGAGPVKLEIARRPVPGDIAITEIMFDPSPAIAGARTSPPEFVEIYNLAGFPLSLAGTSIEIGRPGSAVLKSYALRKPGTVFDANSFAVLYSDGESPSGRDPEASSSLSEAYPEDPSIAGSLLIPAPTASLGLVNTSGFVRLVLDDEIVPDSVQYSTAWHDDRYSETTGRSIARISPSDPRSDALRWTSSTARIGATPGGHMLLRASADAPGYGELRLNEIMFDPVIDENDHRYDQPEYLEMINRSSDPVDLNGIYLRSVSGERIQEDSLRLVYRPEALQPGGFAVAFTLPAYVADGDDNALAFMTAAFPSLRDSGGAVLLPLRSRLNLANDGKLLRLFSADGVLQDEVSYRPDWHHFLVIDGSGTSLERIDADVAPTGSNWSTSTSASGGTPGRRNSVTRSSPLPRNKGRIRIQPKTFSPNGDGVDDTALILLNPRWIPGALRARIFDLYGRQVRTLANFVIASHENALIWDGLDDSGRSLDTGIYIVYVQIIGTHDHRMDSLKAPVALIK